MNVHCPRCETTWVQRGNASGHCAGCHRTFGSLDAFDAHRAQEGEKRVCLDPGTLKSSGGAARFRSRMDAQGARVWVSTKTHEWAVR